MTYYPECRCDSRRPLNPPQDHEKSCPVTTKLSVFKHKNQKGLTAIDRNKEPRSY